MSSRRERAQPPVDQVVGGFVSQPPENEQSSALTWDEYFYAIAKTVLRKSKDKDRKVGAVIVGEGNVILTTGFNGFARGIRETDTRVHPDEKLLWMTHAETNAIFNAARKGISLVGCTLYVTTYPCAGCAQAIVQSGIKRVFTLGEYWIKRENRNRYDIGPSIFDEAGVLVHAPTIRQAEVAFWVARDQVRRDADVEAAADREGLEKQAVDAERARVAELERLADVGRRAEQQGNVPVRRRRDARLRPLAKAGLTVRAPKKTTKRGSRSPAKSKKR